LHSLRAAGGPTRRHLVKCGDHAVGVAQLSPRKGLEKPKKMSEAGRARPASAMSHRNEPGSCDAGARYCLVDPPEVPPDEPPPDELPPEPPFWPDGFDVSIEPRRSEPLALSVLLDVL